MSTATLDVPRTLSASSVIGDKVKNAANEDLGKIEDIMLDLEHGRISYAVLSFGGFLGFGDKLFALPWEALSVEGDDHAFRLNVDRERLEAAEGFDKDNWPEFADRSWGASLYKHYGYRPYWT